MSEIRINIIDENKTISGTMHGSFGDVLVASLTAEPETVDELEILVERFIPKESDWSVFRSFKRHEDFEAWDAGLLVINLFAKVIWAESSYSYYSKEGAVRIKTVEGDDFQLPYKLPDDWKSVRSEGEFNFAQDKVRKSRWQNPPFDARKVLFGKPLFEFIAAAYMKYKNSDNEDLFTEIHAEWLMTEREDLRGKMLREVLLEKSEFIESDLHSRSLQWTFTKVQPPAISKDTNAYKFAGFGRHEFVIYYDLFRHLLNECFERKMTNAESLKELAYEWLNNPQAEFSGRIPARIIEIERCRINLTATAHECVVDEDCDVCQMMAVDFIDSPMFVGYDGSNMEYDRFELSFCKTSKEWKRNKEVLKNSIVNSRKNTVKLMHIFSRKMKTFSNARHSRTI